MKSFFRVCPTAEACLNRRFTAPATGDKEISKMLSNVTSFFSKLRDRADEILSLEGKSLENPDNRQACKKSSTANEAEELQRNDKFGRRVEEVKVIFLFVAKAHRLVPRFYTFGYEYKDWNEYWTFLDNGQVFLGLPRGNVREFDFNSECQQNPINCLSYKCDRNGRIQLDYRDQLLSILPDQQEISLADGTTFKRVKFSPDIKLSGIFQHAPYTDEVECWNSQALRGTTTFEFSSNGRFRVKGCTVDSNVYRPKKAHVTGRSTVGHMRLPGAEGPEVLTDPNEYSEREGSYKIALESIDLLYDDGRREAVFFFQHPENENHKISLNGVDFHRVESGKI